MSNAVTVAPCVSESPSMRRRELFEREKVRSAIRQAALRRRGHRADVALCLRRYSFSICAAPDAIQALLDTMTNFTRPDVHQCPDCQGYLLWPNLKSFNTYGTATTWSDGAAPLRGMLDGCTARSCPTCRAVLWKKDLEVLGTLTTAPRPVRPLSRKLAEWFGDKHGYLRAEDEWAAIPAAWKDAEHGARLEYSDMQRALMAMHALDRDSEMFLRRRIWWATNDHIRRHPDGSRVTEEPITAEADRQANMLRLIELHETARGAFAERAELLRHLGRFEDAISLLTSGASEIRDSSTAAWTLRWAKAGDADVKTFTDVPTVWSAVEEAMADGDAVSTYDQSAPQPKHV